MMNVDIVDFAHQILDMQRENEALRMENKELRKYQKDYLDLLNRDIEHNKHMVGGLLALAMTPGVMEACAKANEGRTFMDHANTVLDTKGENHGS